MARWFIPLQLQPRAIQMHYNGNSARQVYLALWPRSAEAPCSLPTFTTALHDLLVESEVQMRNLAASEGVPFMAPGEHTDDDRVAELTLAPAVLESPLAPADNAALDALDAVRGALIQEIKHCIEDPLPTVEERLAEMLGNPALDEEDRKAMVKTMAAVAKVDFRVGRSGAIANLANAVAANVSVRLRAASLRLDRTVHLHNLRLSRKDEALMETRRPPVDSSAEEDGAEIKAGFVLEMPDRDGPSETH